MHYQDMFAVVETNDDDCLMRCLARPHQRSVVATEAATNRAVLQHRHSRKRLDDLMRARHAATGNVVGFLTGDTRSVEHDSSGVWGVHAVDQVEDGRLACSIRTDEAK